MADLEALEDAMETLAIRLNRMREGSAAYVAAEAEYKQLQEVYAASSRQQNHTSDRGN